MKRSNQLSGNLQEVPPALQHERGPRPLPLFLDLVRRVASDRPDEAQAALRGLALYQDAPRNSGRPMRACAHAYGPARLLDCGGDGPPAILVPSLINPPAILDLDDDVSFAAAVAAMGRKVYLLDWGPARDRASLDVGGHVESLLVPLVARLDEAPALIGYCLGGTMALAAAGAAPVERVATLASPWRFSAYPQKSRDGLGALWRASRPAAEGLGAMPMELLQSAFWSLDPDRTVAKFAAFAAFDPGSADARRFVALEDWANEGEPLPLPAARELIEDFFGADLPGQGMWMVAGRKVDPGPAQVPTMHFTAGRDRIAPNDTAPPGRAEAIDGGHVGMIIGRSRVRLIERLHPFLSPACRS